MSFFIWIVLLLFSRSLSHNRQLLVQLVAVAWQAITLTNYGKIQWSQNVSPGLNGLSKALTDAI